MQSIILYIFSCYVPYVRFMGMQIRGPFRPLINICTKCNFCPVVLEKRPLRGIVENDLFCLMCLNVSAWPLNVNKSIFVDFDYFAPDRRKWARCDYVTWFKHFVSFCDFCLNFTLIQTRNCWGCGSLLFLS